MEVKATMAGQTMAMTVLESAVVIVLGTDVASFDEWNECLDLLIASVPDLGAGRYLMLSDGGAPDLLQRRQLE